MMPREWRVGRAVVVALCAGLALAPVRAAPPAYGQSAEEAAKEKEQADEAARAQAEAERKLEEEKRALEAARAKERETARDLAALAEERAGLNEQLIETARRIQESEGRLTDIENRIGELSVQEFDVRRSIEQRHETIGELLASLQRLGAEPPPALVTRRDDALKMVRSAMMMATLYPELRMQADILARDLDDLVRLQKDVAAEGERMREETLALQADRERIDGLLAEKRAQEVAREGDLEGVREAAARHARSVTYLNDLVQRMDKEVAKRMAAYEAELAALAAAEAKAAAEAAQAQREAEAKVAEDERRAAAEAQRVAFVSPGRIKPAVPFAASRGQLPLPAHGTPVRHFGGPDGYGGTSKGAAVETRESAQITSPTDGWVVYADEFRGYGQLLIINAGGGYHVLLAGMRQIDVSLGQFVLAGEPVAVMGAVAQAEGGAKDGRPVLYIEFRKDGQPIDPDPWWAEGPEKVQG